MAQNRRCLTLYVFGHILLNLPNLLNSENGRLPRPSKNRILKFKRIWILKIRESWGSTASLLTNLRSLRSLENLLLLTVEGLRDLPNLPFSEEWVKRINIPKREGYRKWNCLKEYALWVPVVGPDSGKNMKVNQFRWNLVPSTTLGCKIWIWNLFLKILVFRGPKGGLIGAIFRPKKGSNPPKRASNENHPISMKFGA